VLCLRGGCIFCVTFPALAFSYLFKLHKDGLFRYADVFYSTFPSDLSSILGTLEVSSSVNTLQKDWLRNVFGTVIAVGLTVAVLKVPYTTFHC